MSRDSEVEDALAFAFEVRSFVAELNAAMTALFRPLGLTCVRAEVLIVLAELGPVSLRALSEHLVAESGHPSRLVSRLVADGLVLRAPSTDDGREVVLQLTERGRRLARQAREIRRPLLEEVSRRLSDELGRGVGIVRDARDVLRAAGEGA